MIIRKASYPEKREGHFEINPRRAPLPLHKKRIMHREPIHDFQKKQDTKIYRSDGEREIAEFLRSEHIHFVHEYPMALIDEQEQVRLWYPDFWLPGLNVVIEYLGMKGKPEYEKAVRRKTKLFRYLKIDFILITPKRLTRPDWKHYIVGKILEIMDSKDSDYNKMRALTKKYRHKPHTHIVGDDWGLD